MRDRRATAAAPARAVGGKPVLASVAAAARVVRLSDSARLVLRWKRQDRRNVRRQDRTRRRDRPQTGETRQKIGMGRGGYAERTIGAGRASGDYPILRRKLFRKKRICVIVPTCRRVHRKDHDQYHPAPAVTAKKSPGTSSGRQAFDIAQSADGFAGPAIRVSMT
jgi:hypothetical protein